MKLYALEITLRANWAQSLKEKRMVVQSLVKKIRNRFNVSVGEIDQQDNHQIIVIGVVGMGLTAQQLEEHMEAVINFITMNTEAEIIDIVKEKDFY